MCDSYYGSFTMRNIAPPIEYWLYPGRGMPLELLLRCLFILNMTEEELVKALAGGKALVFTLSSGAPIAEHEREHCGFDNDFEVAPKGTMLSKLFDGWTGFDVRMNEIGKCYLADRTPRVRPFMP